MANMALPSETESLHYYTGLPSCPPLLARTSSEPWSMIDGPWPHAPKRHLRAVGEAPKLKACWEKLSDEIAGKLNELDVDWTSVDIVRLGTDATLPPIVLWIGVEPQSTTDGDDEGRNQRLLAMANAAWACKAVLNLNGFFDIEVEIREAAVSRSIAGPMYRRSVNEDTDVGAEVDIGVAFTPTLGTGISCDSSTGGEGTFGCYVTFANKPGKLFGLTCRHILFDDKDDQLYNRKHTSEKARNVLLPGDSYLAKLSQLASDHMKPHVWAAKLHRKTIESLESQDPVDQPRLQPFRAALQDAEKTTERLQQLQNDMTNKWSSRQSRVIGHVVFSPPITIAPNHSRAYLDWALYEVNQAKLSEPARNIIDLGHQNFNEIGAAMNPNVANKYSFDPVGRMLPLKNQLVSLAEMAAPSTLDRDMDLASIVLKRGRTTSITCGIVNSGFMSLVRAKFAGDATKSTREWAIIAAKPRFAPFSSPGDSGALIVDGESRPVAILTGGTPNTEQRPMADITYATPLVEIFEDMRRHGLVRPSLDLNRDSTV